jgi:hypothetical protein
VTGLAPGEYIVNMTIGDAASHVDQVQFKLHRATHQLKPMSTEWGQFTHVYLHAIIDSSGILYLDVKDLGGDSPYFQINSLEVRPLATVGEIDIERVGGVTSLPANGLTVDTYQGSGAPPNALITLDTSMGTIITPDLPLSVSPYMGMQVQSDAYGNFTFQLRRPSGTGAGHARITATEVAARAMGTMTQSWHVAPWRRFDFNAPGAATSIGFLDVQATHGYASDRGFGYNQFGPGIGSFDRGGPENVTRDGHLIKDGEFSIQVKPGVAYHIRTHLGDSQQLHDKIKVVVDGQAVHQVGTLPAGSFDAFELKNFVSADGILTFRISDLGGLDAAAAINAIEIWESAASDYLGATDHVFGSNYW